MSAQSLLASLRPEARNAPQSGILEVIRHGFGKPGLIPLWAGEGDLPTPAFICEAANRSLVDGETFYTAQTGLPAFREAVARYHDRVYGSLFGQPFSPERFMVTGSGMHAITLAISAVAGAGDSIIVPTPAWPNFAAAAEVHGAQAIEVPMQFGNDGWVLDLEQLEAAVDKSTRAIFINSPSNPTGWTADEATLEGILEISRKHGVWIIADEIYNRFYYEGSKKIAPSFHRCMTREDKIIFVNTFSKNWAMTGWRIGWIEFPEAIGETLINLIQYSTSGTAVFMQRAGIAALDDGDDYINLQIERAREGREIVAKGLMETGKVRIHNPKGAFYHFFSIDGEADTRRLGLRLIDEANIGLAPGDAFGTAGKGFIRLCYARNSEHLKVATQRLANWILSRHQDQVTL